MSSRSEEYKAMIEEILAEDAALRAQGLPGLDLDEIRDMRAIVARAERKALRIARQLLGAEQHG